MTHKELSLPEEVYAMIGDEYLSFLMSQRT
mgnify:CR=1 FL=1